VDLEAALGASYNGGNDPESNLPGGLFRLERQPPEALRAREVAASPEGTGRRLHRNSTTTQKAVAFDFDLSTPTGRAACRLPHSDRLSVSMTAGHSWPESVNESSVPRRSARHTGHAP